MIGWTTGGETCSEDPCGCAFFVPLVLLSSCFAEVKLGTLARDGLTMKGVAATNEKFWQVRSHDVGHGEDGLVRKH